MMTERKRRLAAIIALAMALIMSIAVAVPMVYSWLSNQTLSNAIVSGSIKGSYFEDGDGSEEHPYIIARPIQIYYLAWLQDIGYFNKEDNNNAGHTRQFFFELRGDSYARSGSSPLAGVVEDGVFDMTGYNLPPIGTTEYPFVGHFNGNGFVVANLHVTNTFTSGDKAPREGESTTGTQALGFFGVVGSTGTAGTVGGLTYDPEDNAVTDFILHNLTVESAAPTSNQTLVGLAAGYVNAPVTNVAISESTITVANTVTGPIALNTSGTESDYGLVGFCTEDYKEDLRVERVTISLPTYTQNVLYKNTQGEGAGFGGSIQMKNLFNRLYAVRTAAGNNSTYVTSETITIDEVNGTRVVSNQQTSSTIFRIKTYDSTAGSFSFSKFSSSAESGKDGYDIMYLTGKESSYTKTVTTITKKNEFENGYLISDGTHYLNLNAAATGTTYGTDANSATKWVFSGGRIYTYREDDGNKYYLNGTTALAVSTNASTSWTWSNDRFSYTYSGTTYYLYFNNGWSVTPAFSYYLISDGNGNYLTYNGSLSNATSEAAASHWTFSNSGANPSGYLSTVYNGTTYYLRDNNGTLTATTSTSNRTSWSNNGTSIYSDSNYLRYNAGVWELTELSYFVITDGNGNYLTYDGALSNATSEAAASHWIFSNTGANPSGYISTVYNGTTYYLRDNSGALTTTTSTTNRTSWSNNGTSIYSGSNYLRYTADGGWKLTVLNYYVITDGNGNYLCCNGSSLSNATSVDAATHWTFSNTGANPSGYISAVVNNTTYYLRYNNGLTTTTGTYNRTTWSNDGTHLYYDYYGDTYYIQFANGVWIASDDTESITYYTIRSGSNYLNATSTSALGTGTSVSDMKDANGNTLWKFSNTGANPSGTISTVINGTTYYVYCSNQGTLSLSTSSRTWTNDGGKLYYRRNRNSYYIRYNNGWSTVNNNSNSGATFTFDTTTITPDYTVQPQEITIPAPHSQPDEIVIPTPQVSLEYREWDDIVRTAAQVQVITRAVTTESADYPAETYIPLSVNGTDTFDANTDSVEATTNNTGYIVSGSTYHPTDYPYKSGDIRVSQYNMQSLYRALTTNNSEPSNFTYNATYDSRLEVITAVNYGTYSGFYRVSDDYNSSNSTINSSISSAVANSRKISYTNLGLKRYEDARKSMSETFLNTNKVYGLHFMNAAIGTSIITVPQAIINGEEIENLQVPSDCIDFHVKNRGFLTIFAGTYFTNNSAFFSLHEIFRNDDNSIREIKEISKLYQPLSGTNDYIYLYTDGTYSKALTSSQISSLVLAFDMEWMTNTSVWVNNAVYYFEIPVNGGEFALGSVEGKDGAYLFYLDIAANGGTAEDKDRTTVAEQFTTSQMDFSVPKGVQLVATENSYSTYTDYNAYTDYLDSVTVRFLSGFTGTVPFSRAADNTFTFTPSATSELAYVGASVNATTGSGNAYYPNGYTVKLVETISDVGRETSNTDRMRVETLDTYNSSGVRTSRTVTLYAGLEVEENAANLVKIVTITYDPTGHDNMVTRIVRAASIGGFNVAFSETVTITATLENEGAHVNFGDNTANVLITLSNEQAINARSIPAVDLAEESDGVSPYRKSAIGEDFVTYEYFYDPDSTVAAETSPTFTPTNNGSGVLQSLSLSYAITLTPDPANTAVKVYAKLLKPLNEAIASTTWRMTADKTTTESASVPVTVTSVTVNGNALTYNAVTTLNLGS